MYSDTKYLCKLRVSVSAQYRKHSHQNIILPLQKFYVDNFSVIFWTKIGVYLIIR